MTVESMNKAAAELNTELQKAEKPVEQFNAIAGKAGAKTAAYGPFINPNALLSSVNLQNARSQEELQALLDRAMNSRLAPPKELPVPEEVFQAVSVINPGRMAQPINTGDGILLTQLVKRELEDTPGVPDQGHPADCPGPDRPGQIHDHAGLAESVHRPVQGGDRPHPEPGTLTPFLSMAAVITPVSRRTGAECRQNAFL